MLKNESFNFIRFCFQYELCQELHFLLDSIFMNITFLFLFQKDLCSKTDNIVT